MSVTGRTLRLGRSSRTTCRPARWLLAVPSRRTSRVTRSDWRSNPAMASLEVETRPVAPTVLDASYDKRLMIAAGRSSEELGGRIADRLGVTLTNPGLKTFSNGELYCRFEESIRGADIFLVQSTAGNDAADLTANDALVELLIMIDAAVGASAHRVIAVTPWYGYSRQDKKSAPREPITARLVAKCIETAGADRLMTMDLHAGQLQGFFSNP